MFMLKPCGLLARFVVRSCGFLAAKDGVGPTRPFCSLKTSTGKLFGEKIGLNIGPGPMFGVQSAVWFPCSLLLFFLTWMSQAFLALNVILVLRCIVGLLRVLTTLVWPGSAGSVGPFTTVLRADGLSMVLYFFGLTVEIASGCDTSACVKLILVCPSSSFVVWIRVLALVPWSSWRFALGRPNANVPCNGHSKRQSCSSGGPPRRRPPKHCRRQLSVQGPFAHVKLPSAACAPAPSHAWPSDFASLYVFLLRLRLVKHGLFGPIDLYAPCHSRLLATWCGSKHAVVDWKVMESKWGTRCGPAALVPAIGLVQGKGRKAQATRRVNDALRSRALPPVSGLSCKVPSACLLPTVKQSVRSAIANCSLGWNDHERVWAMSRVRFVVASPSKFRDQFNAPKVSKELQSKRIDAASSLGVLDGLRRVEKVWDVPVRLSSFDASRAVEGCVASCCSKLGLCVSDVAAATSCGVRVLNSCPMYIQ